MRILPRQAGRLRAAQSRDVKAASRLSCIRALRSAAEGQTNNATEDFLHDLRLAMALFYQKNGTPLLLHDNLRSHSGKIGHHRLTDTSLLRA